MLVVPAIDLRAGKCVRMKQGDPTTEMSYDGDPVERAKSFVAAGAQRLHVIDLDGAFGSGENLTAVAQICEAVDVPVQVGGGIRTSKHATDACAAGASEIILGTLLVEDERLARNIIGQFSGKVIAAIDARGREVAIHGWQDRTPVDRDALVRRVAQWGVSRIIFTEIRRDGMGEGYDIDALREVADVAQVKVTASGGARNIDDLLLLKSSMPPTVDSCIVGSALYNGTLDLKEAIAAVA
ncbi:MAG: 1-(5-phosphoribosyl)-5-[(5-phosphoribosylamino)methylideneamino]imidazole-4-carboxamide isomerase [Candidatus Eremiobacteraeota bacterium]|nr:1-(5-phosphoribosyl)-5-[(5-phosphoribosylamino)methylideneamino]imidazole-4-carboxamide isomerase [Candidatus Eremiobacteraeota bacterium]MBV9057239.1 1-(5-phosphoribosyl)-5-[(5-phosphoribosylamino)methylideneamino]imidazole-4-carboxamide isomerase [Candidatus Eremiobacteraeota bacterium]MBV9699450.1 1-(5-phosphoribosyl)-5-[(5-phosphoribosylamino)methylideneamino]imidazole-4-carboxamide isomerase [Candidatus Eremiobacteraeota bacterium]